MDLTHIWFWFLNIPGLGPTLRTTLLEEFRHPVHVFEAERRELEPFLKERLLDTLIRSKDPEMIASRYKELQGRGIHFLHREMDAFPDRLRHIEDPPMGLYLIGKLPDLSRPVLAMVGSRRSTAYGREMASRFAGELGSRGVQIISGLALGVDAASHRGALDAGAYTLGIVGGGIDTTYPRENYNLYRQLYQRGGVLSEYGPGIPNRSGLFPRRNRLISGISDGVFVLEAGCKSGSLITASHGLLQGKDIFALPGRLTDPLSAGCNYLISQGAVLVQTPKDILEVLDDRGYGLADHEKIKITPKKRMLDGPEENVIYNLIDGKTPVSFDRLLDQSGYEAKKLTSVLLKLEMGGWIFQPRQDLYLHKI